MSPPIAVPHDPDQRSHPKHDAVLWAAIILSAGLHFAAFAYWPEMKAPELVVARGELTALDLPPEIKIPEAPAAIVRPAVPIAATTVLSEDITIAETTFEANPVSELPPPPPANSEGGASLAEQPTFTPYTVEPRLLNKQEMQNLMSREYPELLRDARIGGTAVVWFFIDTDGTVLDTRIRTSTGHPQLDDAALRVADQMRFSPALNRDKKVQVWVQFPITFQVQG
jgi:TonB family protein